METRQRTNKHLLHIVLVVVIILLGTTIGYAENLREKFIVAIDIGHTKNCGGALSAHGIYEYYYNQKVACLLLPELIKSGFKKSFIINEDGSDISLIGRTIEAKKRKADFLISIHHDSVKPRNLSIWMYDGQNLYYCDLFKGFSIFVADDNLNSKNSLLLAKILGAKLLNKGFRPTLHHADPIRGENRKLIDQERGIYEFNKLVVLKTAFMPAVLLECGIIKNRDEEKSINGDYRNKLVNAIVAAVIEYHDNLPPELLLKHQQGIR